MLSLCPKLTSYCLRVKVPMHISAVFRHQPTTAPEIRCGWQGPRTQSSDSNSIQVHNPKNACFSSIDRPAIKVKCHNLHSGHILCWEGWRVEQAFTQVTAAVFAAKVLAFGDLVQGLRVGELVLGIADPSPQAANLALLQTSMQVQRKCCKRTLEALHESLPEVRSHRSCTWMES